jgi:hypothetical protein
LKFESEDDFGNLSVVLVRRSERSRAPCGKDNRLT